jgi:hypothetical protein
MPSMPRAQRAAVVGEGRATTAQRGYGGRWQRARPIYLKRHPLCVLCLARGKLVVAVEIDHIQPHNGDPALMWDWDNWQALCKPCHSRKTAGETGIAAILPRFIQHLAKPLTVVVGPPAAGKTTYVAKHRAPADLVLDLDELAQGMGLKASREGSRTRGEVAMLIRERNDLLAQFAAGGTPHPRGWVIATAGSYRQRKFWHELGAEVILIDTPKAECRLRVMREASDASRAARLAAIEAWW